MRWQNWGTCDVQEFLAYFKQMFLIVAIFCYENNIIDPPSLIHKKSHMVPFSLKNSWIRLTFEKSPFPLCLSTLTLSFHDITAHPRSAWTSEHSF